MFHSYFWLIDPGHICQVFSGHPISPLQRLLHQLLCVGLSGGQHALIVCPLTDVAAEDLQDAGDRHLAGQLCGVVCSLEVTAAQRLAPASTAVPQVGAVVENSRKPVIVTADFTLGRLPNTHALCGAGGAVRVGGPERGNRGDNTAQWQSLDYKQCVYASTHRVIYG